MSNYSNLKSAVAAVIKTNGTNAITAAKLYAELERMIDSLGTGYQFMGVATPTTNPGTPDQRVFYIAGPGTYPYFNNFEIERGEIGIFYYDDSWHKSGIDTIAQGAVRYDEAQTLTDAQKAQARENIGASGSDEITPQFFVNSTQTVSSSSTRNKNFDIDAAGKKAVIVVKNVSGLASDTFNLSWVDAEGTATSIVIGFPVGKYTEVLDIPDDAVKLRVFIGYKAQSATYTVKMYNADGCAWMIDELNELDALRYLSNRKIITFDFDAQVSSGIQYIMSQVEGKIHNLSGEIYAAIVTNADFIANNGVKFYPVAGQEKIVYNAQLKVGRVFKIFSNATLDRIALVPNSVVSAGHIRLVLFAAEVANEYLSRPLKDARIVCFGDSNTEFKDSATLKRYSDYLSEMSGAVTYNCGIGGTRLAQRQSPSLSPSSNQQAVAAFEIVSLAQALASNDYSLQIAALDSGLLTSSQQRTCSEVKNRLSQLSLNDIDIITINGGTNDYQGGNSIGERTVVNDDTTTTVGAVNVIIKSLLTAKPTLKIYFFEPIFGMEGNEVTWENSSDYYVLGTAPEGLSKPEWNSVLKDAVKRNHIPFDDWYYTLGFNIYTFSTYYTDNHHAQRGYHVMAEKMYKFLLSN